MLKREILKSGKYAGSYFDLTRQQIHIVNSCLNAVREEGLVDEIGSIIAQIAGYVGKDGGEYVRCVFTFIDPEATHEIAVALNGEEVAATLGRVGDPNENGQVNPWEFEQGEEAEPYGYTFKEWLMELFSPDLDDNGQCDT